MQAVRKLLFLMLMFSAIFLTYCSQNGKKAREISRIDIEPVKIMRYEKSLFAIDTGNIQHELNRLQESFYPFLGTETIEPEQASLIAGFVSDPDIIEIYEFTVSKYPDLAFLEETLTDAFRHIKYYYPHWQPPVVYSYVSGLFYEVPVKYSGHELIIALDMYLDSDFELYRKIGLPIYRINRMTRDHIIAGCMDEIIRSEFLQPTVSNHMLDKMIAEGIVLYLMDKFLPRLPDEYKIGFTSEELRWCRQNESNMWAYFIENELLYISDPMILNRFVSDGPFTPAFRNESPARAALWVGWQIVRAYIDTHRDQSPEDLLAVENAQEVLQRSRYKPRRLRF